MSQSGDGIGILDDGMSDIHGQLLAAGLRLHPESDVTKKGAGRQSFVQWTVFHLIGYSEIWSHI